MYSSRALFSCVFF